MDVESRAMISSLTVPSYAKLNYTLDVLSLRPDGFHNIASVLQCISLADTITISPSDAAGIVFHCDSPAVPNDETNLAFRAARAILPSNLGIRIQLAKRIPAR